jgi:hypothetical protein
VKKAAAKKAPAKKAPAKKAAPKAKVPARGSAKTKVKPVARKGTPRKKPAGSRVAKAHR